MAIKVVLFNGPPSAGKDTAAKAVVRGFGKKRTTLFDRFSLPLKFAFATLMGAQVDGHHNVVGYEERKDEPLSELGGVSFRQWQIAYSDEFIIPRYGDDLFARALCRRVNTWSEINKHHPLVLVPDCGFAVDLDVIAREMGEGNVLLVHLMRTGHDFTGDSRGYVNANACKSVIVTNDTIDAFCRDVYEIVRKWDMGLL